MGVNFFKLNENPMRFVAPIEEAEWNEAWGVYFGTIYIKQKIISACDQEITIHEEPFRLLITKEVYDTFEKPTNDWETDYYGRLVATIEADLYLESLSDNAYNLGHHLKVLQFVPVKRLPSDIEDTKSVVAPTCSELIYDKDLIDMPDNLDLF